MITDLTKQPDYDGVILTLIEKTKEGKLAWKPTALGNQYVCAVKGVQTFKIERIDGDQVILTVTSSQGDKIFDYKRPYVIEVDDATIAAGFFQRGTKTIKSNLGDAFDLARRIAEGIDSKIADTLDVLKNL